MFSDISEIDQPHRVRRHFNIPRENISGDSRLWLLQSQQSRNPSMITSSESNHALRGEGRFCYKNFMMVLHLDTMSLIS